MTRFRVDKDGGKTRRRDLWRLVEQAVARAVSGAIMEGAIKIIIFVLALLSRSPHFLRIQSRN